MVLAVQQIAVGEAFVLAEKLGLSAQSLFDVITGATGNCWAVRTNCPVPGPVPTSPANNDFKPGFATALMNKDLGLAMDGQLHRLIRAARHPRRRDLREVRRRPRRQGLQRGHRTTQTSLTSTTLRLRNGLRAAPITVRRPPSLLCRRKGEAASDITDEILTRVDGTVGFVTLNLSKAINALTHTMVNASPPR